MKLSIRINASGRYWSGGTAIEIAEPLVQVFDPIRATDIPLMALAGEVIEGSPAVKQVLIMRKHVAEELSEAFTTLLMKEMRKYDTHNGYPEGE